ncbi:hypothetical protein FB567DRAFT_612987 [Paraphoma chrysanthemicola]|uniref:polynucleotide adenylyltransferase n=1 Tax=Paraphoma chrysanthemicola TaxID=798071 RepID=A0A8K0QVD2_9PLEO|nr:hypothetical protein FB567DRAFT_612987 [Paraphoma chrysanthemicola]
MADTYRPSRPDRERPPPLADRMTFSSGTGDNYRPGGQKHSEFTFESNHRAPQFPPTGPANLGSHAPRRDRNGGASRRGRNDHHGRNGRNNANGQRRGGYRKQRAPHERALLQHREDGSPEHTYGVSDGPSRFLNPDEMSDDEEADMDVETDASSEEDGEVQNHKIAKVQAPRPDGNSVPRWSNPDPYTALPPPSETTGVKKDVVKFIRKAKNQEAEKIAGNNDVADNVDFISFGDPDDDESSQDDGSDIDNTGARYDDGPVPRTRKANGASHPVEGSLNELDYGDGIRDEPRYDPRPVPETRSTDRSRGRKRKAGVVPITAEWAPSRGDPTPWAKDPQTYAHLTGQPMRWLHNEILDFYDFVSPQPYEHNARHSLVQRVSSALSGRGWFPNGESGRILSFGSYPAGLYLPGSDMDLVYTSDRHFNGGPPLFTTDSDRSKVKSALYKASRKLQQVGMALRPIVIANAKVPIIKFQDRVTLLAVDISFENLSGVQAQATFKEWKQQYPDMVYLVALVKQLLVMRDLNEVHSGGLGGFTIICLIVSFLHHARKSDNLGETFLEFLEYYGKDFDLYRQRIQMHPPWIVDKTGVDVDGRAEKPNGLSIQDPNRPDNNISGGSHKAEQAFKVFAEAHELLVNRMEASRLGNNVGSSILGSVIGGNYDAYIKQRNHLKTLK